MQTVFTIVIVIAAGAYLGWSWMPKRKAVGSDGPGGPCDACNGCRGCVAR